MLRFFYLLLSLLLLLFAKHSQAQADTVRPGKSQLMTRYLKPGLRQYLVCFVDPKSNRKLGFWYWVRDITKTNNVFTITQHWYGSDTAAFRTVYSVNTTEDFAPVYHKEVVRGQLHAFNWRADGINGADTAEGNTRKGFSLAFNEPNYNWNLDIETFEMLPLGAGKAFLINFYDAGLEPPKYVLYTVKGSEKVKLLDGQQTDCWILETKGSDPQGGAYSESYWISKKEHAFIKEADHYGGMIRYKVRMPDTMPDVSAGFDR